MRKLPIANTKNATIPTTGVKSIPNPIHTSTSKVFTTPQYIRTKFLARKLLATCILAATLPVLNATAAHAATVFLPSQGGTGIGQSTGMTVGDCLKVTSITSQTSWAFGTGSCGASSSFATTSADHWISTYPKGYFFSTTSVDYWESTQPARVSSGFSTTSADYWKDQRNFFSTTSAQYFESTQTRWATSSASYFLSQNQGLAFSTTSTDWLLSTYNKGFFFSTSSADYWESTKWRWSTSSSDYWETTKSRWATTSSDHWLTQSQGAAFSTTSADYWETQQAPRGGGSGVWPFTTTASYNSQVTQSTSTLLWLRGAALSLAASSSVLTYASSTAITLSGTLWVPDGASNAPSITFSGDPDTGIYRSGSNILGLSAGASTVLWSGTALYSEANNTRDLGQSANLWRKIFVSFASTTAIDVSGHAFIGTASTSNLNVTNNLTFNGVTGSTWATFCTSITGGSGLCDGSDATGSGGAAAVATSSAETRGQIPYWTSTAGTPATLGSVATTTLGFSGPFSGFTSIGALIGGSNTTVTWTGLATTSQPSSSNILVSNGAAGVYGVATSSATINSPLTGSLTVIGSGNSISLGTVDISANTNLAASWPILLSNDTLSFDGISTTSPWTVGQVAYVNAGNRLTSVATGTVSGTNGITVTSNRYAIGGALAIDCTVATASAAGCLSTTDWSAFNNKSNWPFTTTASYNSQVTQSTSTLLWLRGSGLSLAASSSVLTFASSTAFSATNFWASSASTSNLVISAAKNGVLVTDGTGSVSASSTLGLNRIPTCVQITGSSALCDGDDATGAGSVWPFTPGSYNSIANQSTTTNLWLRNAMIIASTTYFTQASTTQLTNTGNTYLTGLTSKLLGTDSTGLVVGTTSIGINLLTVASTTITASSPITGGGNVTLGGTISVGCQTASGSQAGCVSAIDWARFNSATTTFTYPLTYTVATNAVTLAATSTFYGTGSAGQVLAWANGVPTWQSTSTCAQITGSADLCDGNDASGGGGGAWPFTPDQYNSVGVQSTTTGLWLKNTGIFASTTVFTNATTTNLSITGNLQFGGVTGSTWTAFCVSITGSAGLCDGDDGGAAGSSKWTDDGSFTYLTQVNDDLVVGASTVAAAPFYWDESATTTYIGNGGTGDSILQLGPSGYEWTLGFDDTDDSFALASSTAVGTTNVFQIAKSTLLTLFNYAVTISGNLVLSANLTFDGETFDSLTDDVTLANNSGDLQVVDVTCTGCLGTTEVAGLDVSDDLNLAVTYPVLLTGDTLSVAFGTTTNNTWSGTNTFTGVLVIPQGTGPTADDPGELAHDTSGNQLILDDNVMASAVQKIWSVTIASTSPAFISGGLLAVPVEIDGYTITNIKCKVDSGTSKVIAVEDASANSTEDITCATSVTSDDGSITNATATAEEEMYIDFGATTGAVDTVSISVFGTWTRE